MRLLGLSPVHADLLCVWSALQTRRVALLQDAACNWLPFRHSSSLKPPKNIFAFMAELRHRWQICQVDGSRFARMIQEVPHCSRESATIVVAHTDKG